MPAGASRLQWDGCDKGTWRGYFDDMSWSTLEQSWAYGEAVTVASGATVLRGLVLGEDGQVEAIVQAAEKRVGRLGSFARIVRGPLWLKSAANSLSEPALRLIRATFPQRQRRFLFWLPELTDGQADDALMRKAGAHRVVTGYSTLRLDLRRDLEKLRAGLHSKWRNGLHAGERSGLRVKLSRGGPALTQLLTAYDALQRKNRFAGHPSKLLKAFADASGAKDVTVVSARQGSDTVAAALFLRHGCCATYTAAWASDVGRAANGPRLVLWRGIEALHEQGLDWLDMGGVNTTRTPGLARFKLGLGGEVITLAGTYF